MQTCLPAVRGCRCNRWLVLGRWQQLSRVLSTTVNVAGKDIISRDELKSKVLTLLHKIEGFYPKVLPEDSSYFGASRDVLNRSHEYISELIQKGGYKRRIVVIGPTERRTEVVNAILDDAFSLNASERKTLRDRWKDARPSHEAVILSAESTSPSSDTTNKVIYLRSPLLSRHNAHLIEYRDSTFISPSHLMNADIVLDCRTFLSLETEHRLLPNRIQLSTSFSESSNPLNQTSDPPAEVLFFDSTRALQGINALVQNSSSTISIAIYQHDIPASGLSFLHETIHRRLQEPTFQSPVSPPFSEGGEDISRINFARNTLVGVSNLLDRRIKDEKEDIIVIRGAIKTLRDAYKDLPSSLQDHIIGPNGEKITNTISESEIFMKKALLTFSWWKLPFKVDDLGSDVSAALKLSWCHSLEREIFYESGRLAALQSSLRDLTRITLSSLPKSYQSPVLDNALDQLSTLSYSIKSTSLIQPISTRLNQLINYPTPSLHSSAQRAVLKGFNTSLFSIGGSYTLYLWFSDIVVPETSVALGLLGTVVGLRWAQSSWERAKKEWWKGWKRVANGLEDDLKIALKSVIGRNLVAIPERAANSLEEKVKIRIEKLDELEVEASKFFKEINEL